MGKVDPPYFPIITCLHSSLHTFVFTDNCQAGPPSIPVNSHISSFTGSFMTFQCNAGYTSRRISEGRFCDNGRRQWTLAGTAMTCTGNTRRLISLRKNNTTTSFFSRVSIWSFSISVTLTSLLFHYLLVRIVL